LFKNKARVLLLAALRLVPSGRSVAGSEMAAAPVERDTHRDECFRSIDDD